MVAIKNEKFENGQKAEVVEMNLRTNQDDWISKEEIKKLKMEFLESYFTVEFVNYGTPSSRTYGKSFDFIHAATAKESKSVIRGLWGRYKHHFEGDYEAFFGEIMACVSSAVIQFNESQSTYDYSCMNEKGSSENSRLHAYVVKAGKTGISVLESLLQEHTNFLQWKKRSGENINEFDITSFDAVIANEDGDEITLGDTLGEDASLYFEYDNYHKPHFLVYFYKWFDEQKHLRASKVRDDHSEAELTATQITFFEEWKDVFHGILVDGVPKFDDGYKLKLANRKGKGQRIYTNDEISKFNKQIRERYEEHYFDKFPSGVSFLRMKLMEDKQVLDEVIELINYEPKHNPKLSVQKKAKSLESYDQSLSKWIIDNFNKPVVRDIIHDDLDNADLNNITAAKMSRKRQVVIERETLYSFMNAVDSRLYDISKADKVKYEKWYKRDSRPEQKKREDAMNSDVKVYRNGELVEIIEQKDIEHEQKKKNYTMKRTMPNGSRVELGDNDF